MKHFECGCKILFDENGQAYGADDFCGVVDSAIHACAKAGFTHEAYAECTRKMRRHILVISQLASH